MEYRKYIVQDGDFEICVHNDFNVKNPNIDIDKTEFFKLVTEHGLPQYFHNPNGPAVTRLKAPVIKNYYVNGQACTPEQIERIEHNEVFNKDLNEVLASDQTKA